MKQSTSNHKRFVAEKRSMETWKLGSFERSARQTTFVILVCGVFLSGCSGGLGKDVEPMTPAAEVFTFEQYEIDTGLSKRQTVLTGFLLDGPFADLAVVHRDANAALRLRIYAFGDGTWAPKLEATLSPEVLFADIANIGGRDRLITYARGHLHWFDTESVMEHVLVAVSSNFKLPRSGDMPHVDITRDVNGDDRDDLVVPDTDGFWVFIQLRDGTFAAPVKLGRAPDMAWLLGVDGYRYAPWSESRIHEMDYDRDGRSDLVFWNDDHFAVHLQNAQGLFASVATTFTTDVAFDSDELAALAAPHGVRRRRKDHQPTGALTGRVLHTLTDMNGDGVTDLGIFSLDGGSLWHMHSTYEVHFGMPTPNGGTTFTSDVGTALHVDGIPFGMAQHDFDYDGQVDMMFTTIKPRIFKAIGMIIGAVLTGSVSLDLASYRMEGGIYPDTPNAIRKLKSYPSDETEGKTVFSSVLVGDVNGDRRLDLLVQQGSKELHLFIGVPGPDLFARRHQKLTVAMPKHEEYIWLVDLNKNRKQDILMHHPSTTEPHRVTLLVAR